MCSQKDFKLYLHSLHDVSDCTVRKLLQWAAYKEQQNTCI